MNPKTIESVLRDFKVRDMWGCARRVRRSFRLAAFDNDYMSYLDLNIDEALLRPVVLVTNPPVGTCAASER